MAARKIDRMLSIRFHHNPSNNLAPVGGVGKMKGNPTPLPALWENENNFGQKALESDDEGAVP